MNKTLLIVAVIALSLALGYMIGKFIQKRLDPARPTSSAMGGDKSGKSEKEDIKQDKGDYESNPIELRGVNSAIKSPARPRSDSGNETQINAEIQGDIVDNTKFSIIDGKEYITTSDILVQANTINNRS